MNFYFEEAKIGLCVMIANLVAATIVGLLAIVIAFLALPAAGIELLKGSAFDWTTISGLGIGVVLIALVALLYATLVIRGLVLIKVFELAKVKIK